MVNNFAIHRGPTKLRASEKIGVTVAIKAAYSICGRSNNNMEECMANEGRWAGAAAAAAEAAAAEPDAAAAPPVQQHMHSRRRAKRPMSPVKACVRLA